MVLPVARCRWPPWPAGRYAEVVEHALAAAALATRPGENLGIAALAAAYAGDLDRARTLNDRGWPRAVSPTMRAWGAYVAGEIESAAGRPRAGRAALPSAPSTSPAPRARPSSSASRPSGCSTVRADAGRIDDALRGYREVIDYFARTGNWTHQWTTLRNLADLLRRLGDDEPAALLDAAADRAPDAPADDRSRDAGRRRRPAAPDPRPGRRPRRGPAGHRAQPQLDA